MGKEYECCGQIIEVLRGEAINNRNAGTLLYAAMCKCNRNLLYIVRKMPPDRAGEDHVNDVLSHLYDIPQQYAMDCLAGYAGFDVLMLVYNRPLMSYMSSAVESLDIDAEVNTWQSWISSFYREEFSCGYPQVDGPYTYDWDEIKQDFSRVGVRYDHVIIDEAQDVPIELIESLRIISKGVSCFMDENQTISSTYSNFHDVVDVLGVRTAYQLQQNFRNTRKIFDFAKLYLHLT